MQQLDDLALNIEGNCSTLRVYYRRLGPQPILTSVEPYVETFHLKFQEHSQSVMWGVYVWRDKAFTNVSLTTFVETWRQGCTN